MSLEELTISADLFVNKSTVVYGSTGSGKTTMIKDIMKIINDEIPQVICICPSDPQNHSYSEHPTPLVPNIYIHTKLSETLLKDIYSRQEVLTVKYGEVNKFEVLKRLYQRICSGKINEKLTQISIFKKKVISKISSKFSGGVLEAKIKEINKKSNDAISKIYKSEIRKNKTSLLQEQLDDEELSTLKMIDFNPKLLLILDDVTSDVKTVKKSKALQEILYRGRHVNITLILSLHSDIAFPPELRINTNNVFFADRTTAHKYYEKLRSSVSKDEYNLIKEYIGLIKTKEEGGHCKLVYLSSKNKFYLYTAKIHDPFTFGSKIIINYNDKIKSDGITVSADNPFYRNFTI